MTSWIMLGFLILRILDTAIRVISGYTGMISAPGNIHKAVTAISKARGTASQLMTAT